MDKNSEQQFGISLFDIWNKFIRRKYIIFGAVLISLIVSGLYLFTLKSEYTFRSTIGLTQPQLTFLQKNYILIDPFLITQNINSKYNNNYIEVNIKDYRYSIVVTVSNTSRKKAQKLNNQITNAIKQEIIEPYNLILQRKKFLFNSTKKELEFVDGVLSNNKIVHNNSEIENANFLREALALKRSYYEQESEIIFLTKIRNLMEPVYTIQQSKPQYIQSIVFALIFGLLSGIFLTFIIEIVVNFRSIPDVIRKYFA